ncbi:MAG: FecR domain-containing protein [Bacteroidota bacterium]|nr:FecR domain-containing protein [Bacteroidota bacterium]
MSDSAINESLIFKYIQGQCSPSEKEEILQWLAQSQENREVYFRFKALFYALKANSYAQNTHLEQSVKSFRQKTHRTNRIRTIMAISKYAAILIIAVSIPLFLWLTRSPKQEFITAQVGTNDPIKSITLNDSTKVWLNKNSKLSYPQAFTGDERLVKLEGEAYFEVKKDSQHPFKVQTPSITICVLGTSFNVKTLNNHRLTETTLAEGKVSLQKADGKNIAVMKPGEQTNFDSQTNSLTTKEVDPELYSGWRQGALLLKNVTIAEIAKVIESMYRIHVQVNTAGLESKKYNFTFHRTQPIDTVMEMLQFIAPIKYKIKDKQIHISKN